MIDTRELATLCGVSLKSITVWASKNGVRKNGYRWDFSPKDCQKLFEYYQVEFDELPFTLKDELFTEDEGKLPLDEESNNLDFEDLSTSSNQNEAYELLIEAYKGQIETLQEQIRVKDEQLANKDKQISELITTTKALSASNAVQVASDKREMLLADSSQETKQKKSWWKKIFR